MSRHEIKITFEGHLCRVDKWLKRKYKVPHALLQKVFRKRDVLVNAKRVKSTYVLQNGDVVSCYGIDLIEVSKDSDFSTSEYDKLLMNINKNVLLQDNNLMIINKPYAVAVQNGSKINLSIDTILPKLCKDHKLRLVHRLDRHTTGVLILSKSVEVSQKLLLLFKAHEVSKQYIAVLDGVPKQVEGVLKSRIYKALVGDKERMITSDSGKEAITSYKVISVSKNKSLSLVSFLPVTGRTHQIRIHASAELGCPILGDKKYYKDKPKGGVKMHLHSYKTSFVLDGKEYSMTAPLPEHILNTLNSNNLTL